MKVAVIGAGSWGSALARLARDAGHEVVLWAYEPEVVEQLRAESRNRLYLPEVELAGIAATGDLRAAVAGREMILSVTPSHVVRSVWQQVAQQVDGAPLIVSATKGIEEATAATMVEVLGDLLPAPLRSNLVALSGPSFAVEVARGQPTAVVAAASSMAPAAAVQRALGSDLFRVYTSDDVVGVEIGGAAKNVVAIAVGMSDGLGFGANARAALITRGLAEVTRLAVAKGGNPLTLAGLSGMGDIVLTCTGDLSRNRRVGLLLGQGRALGDIQAEMSMVAEGIRNARSCWRLAEGLGVEMPVTEMVYQVLYDGLSAREGARRLMRRTQRRELDGIG